MSSRRHSGNRHEQGAGILPVTSSSPRSHSSDTLVAATAPVSFNTLGRQSSITGAHVKKLDGEDVKNAVGNASSLLRLLYFSAITYFTTILTQRPTLLVSSVTKPMRNNMIVEMDCAFVCVNFLQLGILVHDFVETAPPKISSRYMWMAPVGLGMSTSAWMATYTLHIPTAYHHPWHWGITGAFFLLNSIMIFLVCSKDEEVRRYWLPILLSAAGFLFQLLVLPKSFPPSHYDALGVERFAPVEKVVEAYELLSKEWVAETNLQSTVDIIKIRYAYELLTNPILKRDYDHFGLDQHVDLLERVKEQYQKEHFLKIDLPLLKDSVVYSTDHAFNVLTYESFLSAIAEDYPLLILLYSKGSPRSAQFIEYWKQIDTGLDDLANTAMVELGDVQLAGYFAEKRFSKQPFFRNGIPAIVAYPANCRSPSCYMRYPGQLSVDSVVDWVASSVIGLPRILYYSKEMLGPQFIGKNGHHKVKVIFFSSTGERAAPFLRKAAQEYSSYASFAFVLWREDESQIWWNSLGVESAPALVFLKGPGAKPVVYHGTFSKSEFTEIMEEHKHQELQQLISDTSLELGCDARGHSRARKDTMIWYCVIVAGRPGAELSKRRHILRKAQDQLISDVDASSIENVDNLVEVSSAATALKDNRLTFVWLDGELQKKICAFYLAIDYNGACGPRGFGDDNDKPEIFIVRFQRNATYEALKAEKKNNLMETLQGQDTADASQLVARYNGPEEIQEINKWISQIIKDGDAREIPYFTSKIPDFVPEETSKEWLSGTKSIRSAGKSLKERVQNSDFHFTDYLTDPRIGPALLMCACISWGTIWFKNIQSTKNTPQDEAPKAKDKKAERRPRPKLSTSLFGQTATDSVADPEPKDARQWKMEDSDSD